MKTLIKYLSSIVGTALLTSLFIFIIYHLVTANRLVNFQQISVAPVPPTLQGNTPSTTTSPTLTYDSALNTYENIAISSIQASERALNIMVTVFSAIMGLATVASGLGVYLYRTSSEAGKKAEAAEVSAQKAQTAVDVATTKLNDLSGKYIELSDRYSVLMQEYNDLRAKTLDLNKAIQARDQDQITQERYVESQQWHSWHKWIHLNDTTGWYELKEHATYENGLTPLLRAQIEMELAKLQRKKEDLSVSEKDFKKKLISLLEIKPKEIT